MEYKRKRFSAKRWWLLEQGNGEGNKWAKYIYPNLGKLFKIKTKIPGYTTDSIRDKSEAWENTWKNCMLIAYDIHRWKFISLETGNRISDDMEEIVSVERQQENFIVTNEKK